MIGKSYTLSYHIYPLNLKTGFSSQHKIYIYATGCLIQNMFIKINNLLLYIISHLGIELAIIHQHFINIDDNTLTIINDNTKTTQFNVASKLSILILIILFQ